MNRNDSNMGMPIGLTSRLGRTARAVPSGASCPVPPKPAAEQMLAMAYVPRQRFEGLYPIAEALRHGTLFSALDLPTCAGGGR